MDKTPFLPYAAPLFVLGLAVIGAFTVANAVIAAVPPSFQAAIDGMATWLFVPRLAVMDVIGWASILIMVVIVLIYPIVGPRP